MIIKSRTLIMETFKKLISVEIQFIFQLLKLCVLSKKLRMYLWEMPERTSAKLLMAKRIIGDFWLLFTSLIFVLSCLMNT